MDKWGCIVVLKPGHPGLADRSGVLGPGEGLACTTGRALLKPDFGWLAFKSATTSHFSSSSAGVWRGLHRPPLSGDGGTKEIRPKESQTVPGATGSLGVHSSSLTFPGSEPRRHLVGGALLWNPYLKAPLPFPM